ncbi:MAG TPA: hypothetical protein VKK79_06690 [Candidatus Lokiarchaeia archaeon]|nr:hypothetical protein [Candidatus Lokiarchaeia archaeon]
MKTWMYFNVRTSGEIADLLPNLEEAIRDKHWLLEKTGEITPNLFTQKTLFDQPFHAQWGDWVLLRILAGVKDAKNPFKNLANNLREIGIPERFYANPEARPIMKPVPLLLCYHSQHGWLAILAPGNPPEDVKTQAESYFKDAFGVPTNLHNVAFNPAETDMHALYGALRATDLQLSGYDLQDVEGSQLVKVRSEAEITPSEVVDPSLDQVEGGYWKVVELSENLTWSLRLYQKNQSFLFLEVPNPTDQNFMQALDTIFPVVHDHIQVKSVERALF